MRVLTQATMNAILTVITFVIQQLFRRGNGK